MIRKNKGVFIQIVLKIVLIVVDQKRINVPNVRKIIILKQP